MIQRISINHAATLRKGNEMTELKQATKLQQLLSWLNACGEAREWAGAKSLSEVWQTCERADWMLWLAAHMADKDGWPTRQQLVLAACACAETSLPIYERKYPNDQRPRKAIETARAWAEGKASIADVKNAASASASAACAAAVAASAAVAAAACAAVACASAATCAASASYAADAAYAAYAACAARSQAPKEMADLVRQMLKVPELEEQVVSA